MSTRVSHCPNGEKETGRTRYKGQMTFNKNSEYIQPANYKIHGKSDVFRNQSMKLNSTFSIHPKPARNSKIIAILLNVHAFFKLRTRKRKPNVHA